MKTTLIHYILAISVIGIDRQSTYNTFVLSKSVSSQERVFEFASDANDNNFEVKFETGNLIRQSNFYLVFESNEISFGVSIFSSGRKQSGMIDLTTFSGNMLFVMTEKLFDGKFADFEKLRVLRFKVTNQSGAGRHEYKVRVEVGKNVTLDFNKIFTTRLDPDLTTLNVNLRYNGSRLTELEKLRFQVTSVNQRKNYALSASVEFEGILYQLNTLFQKTVGGILSNSDSLLCRKESCMYTLHLKMSKVSVLNIESFLIPVVEVLSIWHYDDYYDRVYSNDKITYYNLPYDDSMEEKDITFSIVPISGTTGLYINAKTLPLTLESFDWKEKGPLAKRITIRWKELVQMRAEKSNMFIAVYTSRPGEFLLKIDAHEQGFRGRLNSGVVESGYVSYREMNSYLYVFEVFESQQITFDLTINDTSGQSSLYLKFCGDFPSCQLNEDDKDIIKNESSQNPKLISHTFDCEHKPVFQSTSCVFVIGALGREDHGNHYEISLQEANFHRLMTPGHSVSLNLNAEQSVYFKFSYSSQAKNASLYLSIEALWGSFEVHLSRKDAYPGPTTETISELFSETKLGLYSALRTVRIDPVKLGEASLSGIYYVSVVAKTSCALNIKFYEKAENEITIHTLTAGHQLRDEINGVADVIYYSIAVSLKNEQANSVSIVVTPLKGQFIIMANRNGRLPTVENRTFFSSANHLELFCENEGEQQTEFLIGIKLNGEGQEYKSGSYQFMISMTYSNKAVRLNPGVIVHHILNQNNVFTIETNKEMRTILILKSIVDGYNIQMCVNFVEEENIERDEACQFVADNKSVSVFIQETDINSNCKREASQCMIRIKITGNVNQKVSIGYTYNDNPFQLTKHTTITGPMLLNARAVIHFIYHAEPSKPVRIYFNSKGRDLDFHTKLIRSDHFDDLASLSFPTATDIAFEKNGYVSNVLYTESKMSNYGSSPEILISVRSCANQDDYFDASHYFVLQVSMESKEIFRTQTINENVKQEAWNYFTFYNNGNTDALRIYVSTPIAARLEVLVAVGLQARPPFGDKPIASKTSIGSVEISLSGSDMGTEGMKGHYTVAVKSSFDCNLSVFWNNKEDLNYIEITPNTPTGMTYDCTKSFYFSFYAKEAKNSMASNGNISIYVKSTAEVQIYILKSSGELKTPSLKEYSWKGQIAVSGGVTVIKIKPDHKDYCIECLYIGAIVGEVNSQISILANIKHDGQAISLTPGFTFPDLLNYNEISVFQIYNSDANPIDITISMLSGVVICYISTASDISDKKFDESYALETKLDIYKFISIDPSRFNVKEPHSFYMLLKNPKKESASFTISVDKSSIHSQIEPGITKFFHLAPGKSTDLMYTPKETENLFEVRFEAKQVADASQIDKILSLMNDMFSVYHVNLNNDRFQIKTSNKSIANNKAYFSFDISQNQKGTFAISVKNLSSSSVAYSVDLINGNYKLINFNEFNVDVIKRSESLIYEGYGQKSKYVFVDLRVCHGSVSLEFFQEDYANIGANNITQFKKIADKNSAINYIRMTHEKVFLRARNKNSSLSIYEINIFNENDLDSNPYSELMQGNGGKVSVETDVGLIKFDPISIRSNYSLEFYHRVNYTVFLSDDLKVIQYVKNCGTFMINQVYDQPYLLTFSQAFQFNSLSEIRNVTSKIKLHMSNLMVGTKYFGIVLAKVDLFPREGGYISPVRTGKIFYDEFVFVTAKINLDFQLIVGVLMLVCVFAIAFILIRAYVFGKIRYMKYFDKFTNLANYDEAIFGPDISSILEEEYYANSETKDTDNLDKKVEINIEM